MQPHAWPHDLHMSARTETGTQRFLDIYTKTMVCFPLAPSPSFYLMGPKEKGGVSRRVRIAGPYTRPEAEPAPNASTDVEESAVPSSTLSTNNVLSLLQVAAARETAHAKYISQLQSTYRNLLVPCSITYMCCE